MERRESLVAGLVRVIEVNVDGLLGPVEDVSELLGHAGNDPFVLLSGVRRHAA